MTAPSPTQTANPKTSSDASLLAASRRGETDAFGQLIERYQNLVCSVAFSRTGDRNLSEDVGQETFLTAFQGLDGLREPDKLRSWLCGIARNLSSVAIRKRRRETSTPTASLDGNAADAPTALDSAIAKETEQTVWLALEKLLETYREPLVLFYREDQSVKEVATSLGLSIDAAKQRLSRGREALKGGVAELVEQTLASSRPSKAFTASVLGLVVAHQSSTNGAAGIEPADQGAVDAVAESPRAVAATSRSLSPTIAFAIVGALVIIGAGALGVRALLTDHDRPDIGTNRKDQESAREDRRLVARLRERRRAAIGMCSSQFFS